MASAWNRDSVESLILEDQSQVEYGIISGMQEKINNKSVCTIKTNESLICGKEIRVHAISYIRTSHNYKKVFEKFIENAVWVTWINTITNHN